MPGISSRRYQSNNHSNNDKHCSATINQMPCIRSGEESIPEPDRQATDTAQQNCEIAKFFLSFHERLHYHDRMAGW
jgi:hypothetical protein